MQWYLKVLRNYANFQGRAHRTEYWMFVLVNFIVLAVLAFLDSMLFGGLSEAGGYGVLTGLYSLGILIPGLAVAVRRLHDTGRSGWWLLVGLIPVIGGLVLLVFMVLDSEEGANQYGPNPKGAGSPAGTA